MGSIKSQYERERDWIRKRIKENLERYADDGILAAPAEDEASPLNTFTTAEEVNVVGKATPVDEIATHLERKDLT